MQGFCLTGSIGWWSAGFAGEAGPSVASVQFGVGPEGSCAAVIVEQLRAVSPAAGGPREDELAGVPQDGMVPGVLDCAVRSSITSGDLCYTVSVLW